MRFEYYHDGLANTPKLSVDGTVDNAIHFSHWKGNQTPQSVKADTSTEIALNLVAAPNQKDLTQGIELVTNNHFDTDGVLSVWAVLTGARALELRDKLIAAAEAGDFSELSTQAGVRASIVIQGSESPIDEEAGSPLAQQLAGEPVTDEARCYELVLPHVERVLTKTNDYASLWADPWNRIASALDSFARGRSRVEEDDEAGAEEVLELGGLDFAVDLRQRFLAAHRQQRVTEGDEDAECPDDAGEVPQPAERAFAAGGRVAGEDGMEGRQVSVFMVQQNTEGLTVEPLQKMAANLHASSRAATHVW